MSRDYSSSNQGGLFDVRAVREEEPAYSLNSEVRDFSVWLDSMQEKSPFLYVKRLSANDTGATDSHQVGIYLPEQVVRAAIPSVGRIDKQNPDRILSCVIHSHGREENEIRAVYYNNKHFGGTRDESRLTRWAWPGYRSPMKDPDTTGALVLFAFTGDFPGGDATCLHVWVCRSPGEEEFAEREFGEILPGEALVGEMDRLRGGAVFQKEVEPDSAIPDGWSKRFPTGQEILDYVFGLEGFMSLDPDDRLMKRREVEYGIFQKVELAHVMPLIHGGFRSVEDFIAVANSVANRRKSRSGRSLELHLKRIFDEEGLPKIGEQCTTENRKKPDFLFPCCSAYNDPVFPDEKLRMLGVKTTCKDRWRQVLSEAERIECKHLFTLQEGVSENQHKEMESANIVLVVPKRLHRKYPKNVQGKIMTLADFVIETGHSSY